MTDKAAAAMKAALRKARARGVRVAADGRAFRLTLEDDPGTSDLVLESKGVPLYVRRAELERVTGLRIGYAKEGDREGFTLQVGGGCGPDCACGG